MTEQELLHCVMQLVYILSYANLYGYFHNDITCNNVMIYFSDNSNLSLNKLFLLDNIVHCNFSTTETMKKLPVVKLIDFSYSEYIDYNATPELRENVVVGEPQQILKMIKNKTNKIKVLKNSVIFNKIYNLFDKLNVENPILRFKYTELDDQMSSVGFRTLTKQEILELSIPKSFAETTLLNCFSELRQVLHNNPSVGMSINIINSLFKKEKKTMRIPTKNNSSVQLPTLENKYIQYSRRTRELLESLYNGTM
jgi:serine/threonine protein kinase